MQVHALTWDGRFAGFCIHWQFDGFLFVEHLAVEPHLRGQRLGQLLMQWLLQQAQGPLVLEVEHPVDVVSRRRVAFYVQQGLVLYPEFPYQQPPYQRHGQPVPLCLMTAPLLAADALPALAATIQQQVYIRYYT